MKEIINQIKNSVHSITNKLDLMEDRISENEDTIFNLENKVDQTGKIIRNHEQNLQKLWDTMKRPFKNYWD